MKMVREWRYGMVLKLLQEALWNQGYYILFQQHNFS